MCDFNRLLSFEWRKLWKAKSFRVCIIVLFAIVLINAASNKIVYEFCKDEFDAKIQSPQDSLGDTLAPLTDEEGVPSIADLVNIPYSAHDAARTIACDGDLILVAVIFTGIFAAHDFDSGVMKNIVARGYRRETIIGAKFVVTWCACLIMLLLYFGLYYLATGLLMSFGSGFSLAEVALLLSQLLLYSANIGFVFCIAMLIKKVGFTIAAGILLPSLVDIALSLVELLAKRFANKTITLGKWWIDGISGQLIVADVANKTIWLCAIAAAVYLVSFVGISIYANRRMEI